MLELTDPDVPTFDMGTVCHIPIWGRYLFVPGFYIPSTYLPPAAVSSGEWDDPLDEPYYPAVVVPYEDFSNHSPVVLEIPCDPIDTRVVLRKRIRVNALTDETWAERDMELAVQLNRRFPTAVLSVPVVNIGRFHKSLNSAINTVFYRERRKASLSDDMDPL